jgi:hypothetical protein
MRGKVSEKEISGLVQKSLMAQIPTDDTDLKCIENKEKSV